MTETIKTLLQPIQNRLNAANAKTVHNPAFGDVLRIVWTTYYFGADLKWHNARSGDVESPETLAAEQEAADGDWEWMIPSAAPTDQCRLLAAVQAVLDLHDLTFYDKWGRSHTEDQGKGGWCRTCGRFEGLSCHTFAAIESALTEAR